MSNRRKTRRDRSESRRLSIREVRHRQPDVRKLGRALIGLALAQAQAEADAAANQLGVEDGDGERPAPGKVPDARERP